MQAIAESFAELKETLPPRTQHGIAGSGVERDGSGIWVPGDPWAGAGSDKMQRPMAQHSTVFNAVTQIARNFSSVKLEFFIGDSDKALPPTDPVVQLFAMPEKRAGYRQRQFLAKYAQDMELTGDWFIVFDDFARPGKGKSHLPSMLKRIPRSKMRPDIDQSTGDFVGWIYGAGKKIPPEMVMHSMYVGPYDDLMGLAPLTAAMMEADSDFQAALWNRYVFENGSPGYVFTRDKDSFSSAGKDRVFEDEFSSRNQGARRVSKTAVLPPGMDLKELGAKQRDMCFPDLRQMSNSKILAVFGVPPPVAGEFSDATLANIVHALRFFWYHKLFPMMDEFESVIQSDFLDRFNTGLRCAFKREAVQGLIDDYASKLESATKLWGMGIPFEAINDRLDLGFDTSLIDGADVGFLPFSVRTMDDSLAPPEPAPTTALPPGTTTPPSEKPAERGRVEVTHDTGARKRRWQAYMKLTDRAEGHMLSAWRGFVTWMGDQAIKDLHSSQQAIFLGLITHEISTILPDDEEVTGQALKRTRGPQAGAYKAGRTAAEADLGADLDFALLDRKVLKANQERTIHIKSAALGERDAIREKVDAGIQQGATIDDIETAIRQHMNQSREGMARTVARTETMSAFSRARMDAFGEAGITKQEWMSAHDEDVRPSHQIDGEEAFMGSAFSNGLFFPLDPNGPAEETINCRCVALPVVA